MAITSIK